MVHVPNGQTCSAAPVDVLQIRKVDNEILTAVRQQSSSGARARCAPSHNLASYFTAAAPACWYHRQLLLYTGL